MSSSKTSAISVLIILLFFCYCSAISQESGNSKISGVVTDGESGDVIVGANIVVEGTTKGSSTDIEGKYSIILKPGTYNLHVSALSYAKKIITGVTCDAGKELILYIVLNGETIKTDEVVIEAKANTSYEAVLLNIRKNSSSVSDGISAEQIKRTPDATSADALRRLTGVSLVDNKFVFVRGASDRYNQTTLNGTSVTSTDVGRKSFSYDMLPANLLENTIVIKSASPDMRGDFTGGLVQLNTLDFPETAIFKISYSTAINSLTTGKTISVSQGSSDDWLGYDDGLRVLPSETKDLSLLARELPNTWAPRNHRASPQQGFSISYGNKLSLGRRNGSSNDIGLIFALSYRNNRQRNNKEVNNYYVGRYAIGTQDDYSVLWGAIANLSFKFNGLHKISFKNNFNRSAEDQVSQFMGQDIDYAHLFTVIQWNQRVMYSGQLTGEHKLPGLGGISLEWCISRSTSQRQVPDRKEVSYSRGIDYPNRPFTIDIPRRSWSMLNDYITLYSTDLSIPLFATAKIKTGLLFESKKTDYRVRYFNINPDFSGGITNEMLSLPLDQILDPNNYGTGKFGMSESSVPQDTYNGDASLKAGYSMVDLPFSVIGQKFRFISGVRYENSEQNVNVPRSFGANALQFVSHAKNIDLLPSTNMMWMANEATNLRIAYSNSVNRPEFRELAGTGFWDFIKYEWIAGNPNLQRSIAHNFDVRFEMFPNAGELIAVSYFHKNIHGAIEEHVEFQSSATRTWTNSSGIAENKGWEFEVRKSLGFIGQFWKRFSIAGNYSLIQSSIKDSIEASQGYWSHWTRPMQGQSPYMINLSLLYTEPITGTSVNVLYNKFGRRIDATGDKHSDLPLPSDLYEEPRDIIDLSVTQPVIAGFELKFSIRNLNNKERVLTQLISKDNRPFVNVYERTKTGSTYSLQISKTF